MILGKLVSTTSKKGSRQHLQSITSGSSLLLQHRWRAACLRNQLNVTGELSKSSQQRGQLSPRTGTGSSAHEVLSPAETERCGQVQKHRARRPGSPQPEPLPNTLNTHFSNFSSFSIRWQLTELLKGSKFWIYLLKKFCLCLTLGITASSAIQQN